MLLTVHLYIESAIRHTCMYLERLLVSTQRLYRDNLEGKTIIIIVIIDTWYLSSIHHHRDSAPERDIAILSVV